LNYVTDTHALVWYFQADKRLGNNALKAFEGTIKKGKIIVPTIVLAELMYIAHRGRILISFSETVQLIRQASNFTIADLDIDILILANKIQADLEMHDRLIVATSKKYKAPLLTKDEVIIASAAVKTVW